MMAQDGLSTMWTIPLRVWSERTNDTLTANPKIDDHSNTRPQSAA